MKHFLVLCTALLAFSCTDNNEIIPSGKSVTENRPVSAFSGIDVSNGISLTLSQEEKDEITVEADDNVIPYIETFTLDGTLYVKIKDGTEIRPANNGDAISISVSAQTLESLYASGGSEITFATPFLLNKLEVTASGGPRINGELDINELSCNISGGGEVHLGGNCSQLHITGSGGSKFHLYNLITDDARIEVSGGSVTELYANRTLQVHASGGSKIYYKGDAQVTEQNLEGGSTIHKQ